MIVPPGYERLLQAHAVAVARSDVIPALRQALTGFDGSRSTLHDCAARTHGARALRGRGTAWTMTLGERRVVVRHNLHGGMFAAITGDRFLAPTRAPRELEVSLALLARGVRTPEVLAYVLYPPGAVIQRADVATAEITSGRDLADVLRNDGAHARESALAATADLVASLSRAGARHHDLNAKNVLIARDGAWVLDVDRVALGQSPADALEGNMARLARSLRKWRQRFGVEISDAEIGLVDARARALAGHH
ncbi:MAG TPA: lipopolysaccharide kinase InaA family protein [Gemmatimonadaceae bacterium]|nr:lipopolysaccharide kinase InaA family protein [Gemmatimonadaceae bacterium]